MGQYKIQRGSRRCCVEGMLRLVPGVEAGCAMMMHVSVFDSMSGCATSSLCNRGGAVETKGKNVEIPAYCNIAIARDPPFRIYCNIGLHVSILAYTSVYIAIVSPSTVI